MDFLDVIDTPSCNQFNALIMEKPTVVQFFSEGCGYCHQLEPEWDSLKDMLKEKYQGDMMLARVRDDMIKNIKCDKDIEGFPTIFVLKKGKKKQECVGNRNSAELLKFIEDNIDIRKKTQKGGRRNKKYARSRRRRRYRHKTKRKRRRTRRRRRKSRRIKKRRV